MAAPSTARSLISPVAAVFTLSSPAAMNSRSGRKLLSTDREGALAISPYQIHKPNFTSSDLSKKPMINHIFLMLPLLVLVRMKYYAYLDHSFKHGDRIVVFMFKSKIIKFTVTYEYKLQCCFYRSFKWQGFHMQKTK